MPLLSLLLMLFDQYNFTNGFFIFSKPPHPAFGLLKGEGTKSPLVEFYKRVVLLFKSYSCHRPMTAINFSIVSQGEELRLNAVN